MWIWIIVSAAVILWAVYGAADMYLRKHFIPEEEMWEKVLRPDTYVPWSYGKRMRYYDRLKRNRPVPAVSKRPYVSYIETGYIHRND